MSLSIIAISVLLFRSCHGNYTGCLPGSMSDGDREAILTAHNSRRSGLAMGTGKNRNGAMPKAVEMYRMVYDCDLEKEAQFFANNCSLTPTSDDVGIVRSITNVTAKTNREAIEQTTAEWWMKINKISISPGQNPIYGSKYSTFSQMAWFSSVNIGCGVSLKCNGKSQYVVCLYYPPGNFIGESIYQTGDGTCKCKTYKPISCDRKRSLCVLGRTLKRRNEEDQSTPEEDNAASSMTFRLHNCFGFMMTLSRFVYIVVMCGFI